jgi:4-amino-4-deoxy-L-arabinose transferase-like glycosyltransferase
MADGPTQPSRRRATWLFLAAVALNGLAYLLLLRPWMGEDEPWQLEYASHVADGYLPWGGTPIARPGPGDPDPRESMSTSQLQTLRRFGGITPEVVRARQVEILESMRAHGFYERADWAGAEAQRDTFDMVVPNSSATTQPPLYFLVAGTWMRLCGARDIESRLWAGRWLSWILSLLTAAAVLAFTRTLFDDERVALCAAALAAFLPMSARQAALFNNDVLAKLLAALLLWLSARWLRGRGARWELVAAFVAGALALQTKTTAAGAVGALVLAIVLRSRRFGVRLAPLLGLLGVLAGVGWALLHFVFADNPAMPHSVTGFVQRIERSFSAESIGKFARTLAGSFGWESRFLPATLNVALGLVLAATLARLALARRRVGHGKELAWLALALATQVMLILLRGTAVGRYLMPMLPVLAALLAGGLVLASSDRDAAARRCLLALIALDAYYLFGGLVLHETLLLGR